MRIAGRKGPHDLSFLTNYRPNFCSECGEKIVRLRWRIWTSRRFCDKCSRRFVKAHWTQRACVTLLLLCSGILLGRGCRRERPPLVIQRTASAPTQNPSPPVTIEETHLCGARTKKGTPCSRRVRGPIRCWQHRDLSSIIPVILIK